MMNRFGHWSRGYVKDKTRYLIYRWTHGDAPWLRREAVERIEGWLRPSYQGVEWGAGRSTLWFARRVRFLASAEHCPEWAARVRRSLGHHAVKNVRLLKVSGEVDSYVDGPLKEIDGPLDFALVDGLHRDRCAAAAVTRIRPGGWLIVDDVNRYLPCSSRAPESIALGGEPATPEWSLFRERVSKWSCAWFSDGISDTAIWERP